MRKYTTMAVLLILNFNLLLAYDGYNNTQILIKPNKIQNQKNCDDGYGQCNNLLSNSDVFIIIDEPINGGIRKNYNRKNYQRNFRSQNIYDPRNGNDYRGYQKYQEQDYNQGYNDGYNDARNDYDQDGYYQPQIGIRIR